MNYKLIEPEKILEMLFNDSEYVIEFCEAGATSFREFIENYEQHLINRNLEDLKKAGHKIKPGAQMIGADEVVEEYEHAKKLLHDNADQDDLHASIDKMKRFCEAIQEDLARLAQNQN